MSSAGGHVFAVPAKARQAIASGRLDRRLFDVTTLLAELGDDGKSSSIPVIVEYNGKPAEALAKTKRALPGVVGGTLLPSLRYGSARR